MYPRIYKSLENQSFFVFGPRGTGKSTWLKETYPQATLIDLLNVETARLLLADPHRLESMIKKSSHSHEGGGPIVVIIDEVQKIPVLLDEVHRLIETKKFHFILTGSSARKLRRGGANLLAGRALQRFFFPLTCWELGKDFDLTMALKFGMLPMAVNLYVQKQSPKEFLSSYVYTYLKEEVFAEGLTRSLEKFSRFLETISFSQAQPINMSTIASDVGVDSKMIATYLEILEDLLLGIRLPIFNKQAKRRLTTWPKFFLFDCGVFRELRPKGPLDSDAELDSASLETLFLQHHQALVESHKWDQKLYFWRTSNKAEVDFISYGERGLFAFEIKKSATIRSEDLKSLKLFQSDYPESACIYLYGGVEETFRDNIQFISFETGLKKLELLLTKK